MCCNNAQGTYLYLLHTHSFQLLSICGYGNIVSAKTETTVVEYLVVCGQCARDRQFFMKTYYRKKHQHITTPLQAKLVQLKFPLCPQTLNCVMEHSCLVLEGSRKCPECREKLPIKQKAVSTRNIHVTHFSFLGKSYFQVLP